ncbi:hypothetical protein ILUMI_26127 [Ignelater luminosus]|uniref:Vitellogenin domain-containing protein n=1 Tax=Ignelater luminosus TaxID=2038154 RepID=A0A8K0C4M5_IGNLU|nr:hypothetical protein ILUMI_26127 [Ignelater luminosus]
MGHCTTAILFALSVLSFASAHSTLIQHGKEFVYDYKALVKAGTIIPAAYASEFYLHGKLHLQHGYPSLFAQLSDLKYKVHNGEDHYGHEHEAVEFPLPKEAEDLLMPFKIVYHKNGQVKQIVTEKHQKIYARNMHKAIAAMLQMNVEKVNLDSDKAHAFMTDEYSIYGKTVAAYNVLPKTDRLVVQKMHEMKSTRPIYQSMIISTSPSYCEAHYEEPMSHDSHQYYVIVKQDGYHIVKHMESTGGIYIYPFQAKSEAEYVLINVTLNLVDIVPVQKAFQITSEHVDEDLTYQLIDPSVEDVPDIMNGRRTVDKKQYIPVLEKNDE